ncbi:hypothetical protein QYE76_000818 [Lolium multiflorum]|uniref:Reverse transcriptase Ty1/copia-type domain-containing protein n=1 Tax=Lolium multiflorum TaxID=4521 RepID=A0AAD8RIH8_LOLMU|nr:hypothetical protein QYE76_000818 [Lolium multiflorum]
MENYSLLMGAAMMKMAVEMVAVSMEKPGHFPVRRRADRDSSHFGFAMAAALEGFAYRGLFPSSLNGELLPLMGAAVMKMAVEMAAVSMEKPSGHFPVPGQETLSPGSWLRDGGGSEGFATVAYSVSCFRFLIVKSEVSDMHVGTIIESNDATFFEDIFHMKDKSSSSNQEMPSSSSQELVTISEPTIATEHYDNPVEDDNEAPKRSKRQRTAKYFGHYFIVYLMDDTPTSISEAYASQDADYWKEVVRSEMDSIFANGTWEVTDRPYGCKPIGCKWVFKKKLRSDGTIEKYKARLVAKGYTQKKAKTSLIHTHL